MVAKKRKTGGDRTVVAARSLPPWSWESKIVGHDRVAPDQLMANPLNFRLHPPKQREALRAAIASVGFIRSVTVNRRTGHLLDGHERVWQALQTEQPFIDVEYVDLSEADEKLALATLDPISEMATLDAATLNTLLNDCQTGEEALQSLFSDLAGRAGLYSDLAWDGKEQVDPSEVAEYDPDHETVSIRLNNVFGAHKTKVIAAVEAAIASLGLDYKCEVY